MPTTQFEADKLYRIRVSRVVTAANVKLRPRYEYTVKGAVAETIEDAIASWELAD